MTRRQCLAQLAPIVALRAAGPSFVEVAAMAGLIEPITYGGVASKKHILETNGCGVAFIGYDNDRWLDIYFGTGAPQYETLLPNRMFRNDRGQWVNSGTSFGDASFERYFGLASARAARRVDIVWPSGARPSFVNLQADMSHRITEGGHRAAAMRTRAFQFQKGAHSYR